MWIISYIGAVLLLFAFWVVKAEAREGWSLEDENWYYYEESGERAVGWKYINGNWYYLEPVDTENLGIMMKDCEKIIEGQTYFFDSNGSMLKGWIRKPEGWYYADSNGSLAKGWRYIGGTYYYLDGENEEYPGLMLSQCKRKISNYIYKFDGSGRMKTGWAFEDENWYYYDGSGALATGWRYVNGNWYYMEPADGKMIEGGWKLINNTWYFFNTGGAMVRNWLYVNGNWYYMSTDGAMKSGWQLVGCFWYYMEPDGHMITGWKKLNGVWYYMNSSGQMVTGRQDINGLRYYFNQGGAMAETDISNVISNALKPVGKTLYVWGGGWNEADNGSGETSLYIGVWPQWEQYFRDNKNNYSYKPGQTAWKKGNRDYRFLGLDCSGYIGWLMYNSIQYGKDSNGYVTTSTNIAGTIAGYGFGNASACTPESTFYPGDIVSSKGHCFLCLGQCQDGSVLILHSTPNGGVQMSGTVNGSGSSQASRLAQTFMQQYYPEWWNCFGKEGRQSVKASTYLYGTKFSWQNPGAVYDSQGMKGKSAEQVLDYIRTMK